jgi:hypothetical protein
MVYEHRYMRHPHCQAGPLTTHQAQKPPATYDPSPLVILVILRRKAGSIDPDRSRTRDHLRAYHERPLASPSHFLLNSVRQCLIQPLGPDSDLEDPLPPLIEAQTSIPWQLSWRTNHPRHSASRATRA